MPILMDQILTEFADQAYDAARLGRNGVYTTCCRVLARVLSMLEACGDAMRFVDAKGRVAWKASPQLRSQLKDLELDAQDDLEDI
jgi:hypothetical protein